jgi:2-keto-4-pentenoate hydratase/2-oxohepta-3-ene-1,7-dioic acid hydratase in catechol pathway
MRLVTYTHRGTTRLGAMLGDVQVVDLNRACACQRTERGEGRARVLADFLVPADMPAFLDAGDPAMEGARAALAWAETHVRAHRDEARAAGLLFDLDEPGLRLEAPVRRPGKVLTLGLNYKSHAEEAKLDIPQRPLVFAKVSSCITGPGVPIHRPKASTRLDFEGELCVVIGRRARHVVAADALAHVAGYMVATTSPCAMAVPPPPG